MNTAVSTILVAILVGLIVLGALLGVARKIKKATLRLVTVAIAAIVAFLLSGSLASALDITAIKDALAAAPEVEELLLSIPSLLPLLQDLLRPILFTAAFASLFIVFWVLYLILSLFVRKKEKDKPETLLAGLVGAVQGLLVAAILLTPVLGYATLADEALATYNPRDEEKAAAVATLQENYIDPIRKNGLLAAAEKMTAPLFAATSAIHVGEGTTPAHELPLLLAAYDRVTLLAGVPLDAYGPAEKEAVRDLSDLFADSAILPTVSAELLSAATAKWQAGDSFIGIAKPAVEGELAPLFDALIDIFSDSTAETLTRDLDTVAEFFILLIDYDMTDLATGEGDVLAKLTDVNAATGKTFLSAAVELLDANPHLSPLRHSVTELGATVLAKQFGTPEELRENYGEMVGDVVTVLKDIPGETNEEKVEAITPHIKEELAANDIDIPEELVDEASRYLLTELENKNVSIEDLTEDDVFDILEGLMAGGIPLP